MKQAKKPWNKKVMTPEEMDEYMLAGIDEEENYE